MKKRFLAMLLSLVMLIGLIPVSAEGDASATTVTMDDFLKQLAAANYNFDGKGLVVEWSSVSGCYQTGSGTHHNANVTCPTSAATGNTPTRVNSKNAQYYMDSGYSGNVSISNVNFKFTPAAVTICANSSWAGSYTENDYFAAQLYFQTSGDVTFEGCSFDKVVVTSCGTTGTSTVNDCSFSNLTHTYAIKDIRGANIVVENNKFENCSGGIMVSQVADNTNVDSIKIKDNDFNSIGTGEGVTDRGIVQIAERGDYANADIVLSNNTATDCASLLRMLNSSASVAVESGSYDVSAVCYSGDNTPAGTVKISGGSYPINVSDYVAAGNSVTESEGDYSVVQADEVDMDTFMQMLEDADYNFDGESLVVEWSPESGCYQTSGTHHNANVTCPTSAATGNTPARVNSANAQYHIGTDKDTNAVTIKNVNFVFKPAAFTICKNSDWAGSYTADTCLAAQLFFQTSGDVTFKGCSFDQVVVTSFGTTGTSTVKNCSFSNLTHTYAIKDIRGANIVVENNKFENCSGGIMVSQVADNTAVTSVKIKDNDFNSIGTGEGVTDRGIVQIAERGDYANADIVLSNNTAADCASLLRMLNSSASVAVESGSYVVSAILSEDSYSSGTAIGDVEISGGSYSIPVDQAFCADAFVCADKVDSDGMYVVVLGEQSGLTGLELSRGTLSPAFDNTVLNYSASVSNSVRSITVTPTLGDDSAAAVAVNGKTVESGEASDEISLRVGKNTISVVVTLEDAGSTTYTITVTRAARENSSRGDYKITVEDAENGKVTVSDRYADKGDTVTLTVKPDKGYELDKIVVTDEDGEKLKLTEKGDGKYTFKMPKGDVEIEVRFVELEDGTLAKQIILTLGSPVAIVDGEEVVNDVAPVARNWRTMLPIRFVAEALGATVEWDADNQRVTITKGELVIEIYIGSDVAYVNGQPVQLDSPAFAENNRTYLPLRFVAENLGALVEWDQATQTVTITANR